MKAAEYFSSTVPEAHQKFVSACEANGFAVEVFRHPLSDPEGKQLTTAACRFGSSAKVSPRFLPGAG
jgi:hypothetical protein